MKLNKIEKKILKLIASSKTYAEISKITKYSKSGTQYYVRNLFNKYNVDNRNTLVLKAIKTGDLLLDEITGDKA